MKSPDATIQMKATELYFPVVLFIMPYKVVLPFETVDEILKCEQYFPMVLCFLLLFLFMLFLLNLDVAHSGVKDLFGFNNVAVFIIMTVYTYGCHTKSKPNLERQGP